MGPVEHKVISRLEWSLFGVLLVVAILSFFVVSAYGYQDGLLHVYFLDVGQGDAEFIQTPEGQQVLIDGGPDGTVLERLGQVMPYFDRYIDVVILTHPDADHLTGLIPVLEHYDIGLIVETGVACETSNCLRWQKAKTQEGAPVHSLSYGDVVQLEEDVQLDILHPLIKMEGVALSDKNNSSIVAKLFYGEQRVLFTGDVEAKVERKLVMAKADLSADFLKVAHHGSKTSTTEEFLRAVNPDLAFISSGKDNKYGHPHELVTDRLESFGIKYYRTDMAGSVDLQLDGINYQIKNF